MTDQASRTILVTRENGTIFRVDVPVSAKLTYGPWSPANSKYGGERVGTLRVYRTEKDVLAVFSGVVSFCDTALNVMEIADKSKPNMLVSSKEGAEEMF